LQHISHFLNGFKLLKTTVPCTKPLKGLRRDPVELNQTLLGFVVGVVCGSDFILLKSHTV
jgi:hypothetical protein